jgi:hypothetical protein
VGYPPRLPFRNRLLPGFPGGNVIQFCSDEVLQSERGKRLEGGGRRLRAKCQMPKFKVRNPCKGGKTSSERESKIFSPSLGNEGAPQAIFVGSGRWNGRKKIFEQRRASFFEISRERVEAEDEMPKFKIQMTNDGVRATSTDTIL